MATQNLDLETQEQLDQIKFFWKRWGNLISAVIIVVALAFLAWQYYQRMQASKAQQAADVYAAMLVAAQAGESERVSGIWQDLQGKYAGTAYAEEGALLAAAALAQAEPDTARQALRWVAEKGKYASFSSLGRLRLSALLVQDGDLDAALAQLQGKFPASYAGLVADRQGDIYALKNQMEAAASAYATALAALPEGSDFHQVVSVKQEALGSLPAPVSAAAAAPAEDSDAAVASEPVPAPAEAEEVQP